METFKLERTPTGDRLHVDKSGPDLLRFPLYNKGTAFTLEERRELGIEGLLPAQHNDIETQVDRIFKSIFFNRDDVGRNIGLAMLQDRNEVLFYKLLSRHLEEIMPIIYTPTVGKASQYYSRVFRRGRGIFITPDYSGRIEEVLRSSGIIRCNENTATCCAFPSITKALHLRWRNDENSASRACCRRNTTTSRRKSTASSSPYSSTAMT